MTDQKYPCPCCGYLTLRREPPGTFTVCPVCHWEDDNVQFIDPSYLEGANRVCLKDAQWNYYKFGAIMPLLLDQVRGPFPDEHP